VRGVFLNPMNEAALNELPFLTAADYLADPSSFRARASFRRAVRELGGPARASLRAFAEVNYSDPFDRSHDAPTFRARSRALLRAYDAGGAWPREARALAGELALVRGARKRLGAPRSLRAFVADGRPFLRAAALAARAGAAGLALLEAERPALTLRVAGGRAGGRVLAPAVAQAGRRRARLAAAEAELRADFRNTYGDRPAPGRSAPATNRMDAFLAAVASLDAGWQPRAAAAAGAVTLTLDGQRVAVGQDGRFTLPAGASGRVLRALDGAGGRTSLRVPRIR
jgi:hypothetical protein